MPRTAARRPRTPTVQRPAATQRTFGTRAVDHGLDMLQSKADGSAAVTQLRAVQSKAAGVVQREVDTSSSPALPDYEDGEKPAWKREQGVPGWAEDEYKAAPDKSPITGSAGDTYATGTLPWDKSGTVSDETKAEFKDPYLSLMCSIDDGKIGSIYFEGGRIRTTHSSGPTTETHEANRTFQYNIDRNAAWALFVSTGARRRMERAERKKPEADRKSTGRLFNSWIAQQLKGRGVTATPTWATPLDRPEDAFETGAGADASGLKLFEVMMKPNNRIKSKHASRGTAAQINIKASDLEKLKGVGYLMKRETDPKKANVLFYEYVRKHLPHLLNAIRHPSEV